MDPKKASLRRSLVIRSVGELQWPNLRAASASQGVGFCSISLSKIQSASTALKHGAHKKNLIKTISRRVSSVSSNAREKWFTSRTPGDREARFRMQVSEFPLIKRSRLEDANRSGWVRNFRTTIFSGFERRIRLRFDENSTSIDGRLPRALRVAAESDGRIGRYKSNDSQHRSAVIQWIICRSSKHNAVLT